VHILQEKQKFLVNLKKQSCLQVATHEVGKISGKRAHVNDMQSWLSKLLVIPAVFEALPRRAFHHPRSVANGTKWLTIDFAVNDK
jgi:hypothetical protein